MARRVSPTPIARHTKRRRPRGPSAARPGLQRLAAVAGLLAVSTFVNHRLARQAEQRNPPLGQFLAIDGVRLHYAIFGEGPPLVLLHGNGSMIQDFTSSGLVAQAARSHRVIIFDRPGYGHSTRPRGKRWSGDEQADLIKAALDRIGVSKAVVLGHSWGASVAVAVALRHPQVVRSLVLVSGYFYPTPRVDMLLMAGPAVPVFGDILRYSITPIASRLLWPMLLRKIFGPAHVPRKFRDFPMEMAVRPSQLRASATESALLIPMVSAASTSYPTLTMPVVIVAGSGDRLIDPVAQSARLHSALPHSTYHQVPASGHMVHQTDTAVIMKAITEAFGEADSGSATPSSK